VHRPPGLLPAGSMTCFPRFARCSAPPLDCRAATRPSAARVESQSMVGRGSLVAAARSRSSASSRPDALLIIAPAASVPERLPHPSAPPPNRVATRGFPCDGWVY
jgi:hypothetical protein